jgi:hypothetical protein
MSAVLRQDIYNTQDLGLMTKAVTPDPDRLDSIRCSCVFWLDYFCEADNRSLLDYSSEPSDNDTIFTFCQRHFLHWLEDLSLIHKLLDGVLSIWKLLHRVRVCDMSDTAYDCTPILSDSSLNLLQILSFPDSWRMLKSLCLIAGQL